MRSSLKRPGLENASALVDSGHFSLAFHGTSKPVKQFETSSCGVGSDANSALGLFLAETPSSAAEYAEIAMRDPNAEEPVVYAVAYPSRGCFVFDSFEDFFGVEVPAQDAQAHFQSLRIALLDKGYDHAAFEGMDDPAIVCLDPDQSVIIARLTIEQAMALSDDELEPDEFLPALKQYGWLQADKPTKQVELGLSMDR